MEKWEEGKIDKAKDWNCCKEEEVVDRLEGKGSRKMETERNKELWIALFS